MARCASHRSSAEEERSARLCNRRDPDREWYEPYWISAEVALAGIVVRAHGRDGHAGCRQWAALVPTPTQCRAAKVEQQPVARRCLVGAQQLAQLGQPCDDACGKCRTSTRARRPYACRLCSASVPSCSSVTQHGWRDVEGREGGTHSPMPVVI